MPQIAVARLRNRKVTIGFDFYHIEMKLIKALGVLLAAFAAIPATAQQLASDSVYVNLRAGPGRDYPVVAMLPAGIDISVIGCLSDYRWCDVVAGPDRGWVYAGNIVYPYQAANVPLLSYGPVIGIGIIAFNQDHYWHRHYRARPWYRQRQYWIDRPHPDMRHGGRHVAGQPAPPVGFRVDRPPGPVHWPAPVPPPEQRAPGPMRPPPLLGPGAYAHPAPHPRGNQGHGQPRGFAPPHR